jgi:hypothetical protein
MDFGFKPHWIAALTATAAVTLPPAQSSATLADLHGLSPRQVLTAGFSLASPQEVRIEATGAEPATSRSLAKIRSMLKGKDHPKPWPGNAWILDLSTRKVVWELSTASGTSGPANARLVTGSV